MFVDVQSISYAKRLADRLRISFWKLFCELPIRHRNTQSLQTHFGLSEVAAANLHRAFFFAPGSLQIYFCFPEPPALLEMVRRSQALDSHLTTREFCRSSAEAYGEFLHEFGPTLEELKSRLAHWELEESQVRREAERPAYDWRRQQSEAMAAMLQLESEQRTEVWVSRPSRETPGLLSEVFCSHEQGVRRSPVAPPLTVSTEFDSPSQEGLSDAILDDFCSSPLKFSRIDTGEGTASYELRESGDRCGSLDYALIVERKASRPSPLVDQTASLDFRNTVRVPVKRLMVEYFIHQSLASGSVPYCRVSTGLGHARANKSGLSWFDSLSEFPEIRDLGFGSKHPAHETFDGHRALVDTIFERSGWNDNEFLHYRVEVDYPLWSAQYIAAWHFQL